MWKEQEERTSKKKMEGCSGKILYLSQEQDSDKNQRETEEGKRQK